MNKKPWNSPTLTTYGSVEQLTEQVIVGKVPGAGDTITVTVDGIGSATVTTSDGSTSFIAFGSI